ncbi:MAG: carbohydrate kinase [Candidatus Dormibacteraeota bacterium]|nr:carbohydrate kinase [Candidatus Dormibacteraeota bacterium]
MVPAGDGTLRPMPGGGPFNTARSLGRLDVPTSFLGRLSTDPFGRLLAGKLAEDAVDLSLTSHGPEPTTLAVAELNSDGRAAYQFYSRGTSAPNLTPAMLPTGFEPDVTALHVGTLGLVLEPMASTLAELVARESATRVVMLDPNIRPAILKTSSLYRGRINSVIAQSTIVKASDADVGWLYPGFELEAAAGQILAAGARLVVVTLGAQGAFGVSQGVLVRVPAPAVDVVDTIGAGDAFGAALLAWLHDHNALTTDLSLSPGQLESALEFACLAASLTCTRAGAEPPWRKEITGGAGAAAKGIDVPRR